MGKKIGNHDFAPIIISPSLPTDQEKLLEITYNNQTLKVIDTFNNQLEELFQIRHPKHKNNAREIDQFTNNYLNSNNSEKLGKLVYYPWNNTLVHILSESEFFELRTARNIPLISKKEQKNFSNLNVGIIGLSVGNSIALSIAYSGGANTMKLADPDHFELSNLNRVRVPLANLGENKTVVAAKQIYEINPYANLALFPEGVTANNLKEFMLEKPKIDVIIDEADDIVLKFHLRLAARALGIPLVMATDNGYNVDIDVLRFDLNKNAGGMKDAPWVEIDDVIESLQISEPVELTTEQEVDLINQLIGIDNVSTHMQDASILKIKQKIAGWPQLAISSFIGGGMASYATKQIAISSSIKRNKSTFSLHSLLKPGHSGARSHLARKKKAKNFKNFMQTLKSN